MKKRLITARPRGRRCSRPRCCVAPERPRGEQPLLVPHHPLYMPDARTCGNPALQPPGICCIPGSPFALGTPMPPNMGYYGGHVQVDPEDLPRPLGLG